MDNYSAKLYFEGNYLADINQISYATPWFVGRHAFSNKQLLAKLIKISQFCDSDFWTDDSLSDDEQDQKLDELQLSLNITDEEIDAHLYDKRENWLIILSNGKQFIGFPRIDETTVEWR